MSWHRAFFFGWVRVIGILGAPWAGITLFHDSLVGFAAGVITGAAFLEFLPNVDLRSEATVLVAEWVGTAAALAFGSAYWRLPWWYFAALVVLGATIQVARVRSARSR